MSTSCQKKSQNSLLRHGITCSTLFILAMTPTSIYAHHKPQEDKLVIGIVSSKAKKNIKRTTPLVNYLVDNLSDYGFNTGEVWVSNSIEQMGEWLRSGDVDIVTETVFSGLTLKHNYGADIGLLRWKKGVNSYQSILFTHQDSGIDSLDDLLGKAIAFEDKGSTSGYYLPAATLLNEGYQLQKLRSVQDIVDKNKIGYVFIEEQLKRSSEVSSSAWVYRRQVAAGAFSNLDWEDTSIVPDSYKNKLKIIHKSIPIPRSVILYSPMLSQDLRDEISTILVDAEKSKVGNAALNSFQKTKKFERFDDAVESLEAIEELHKIVTQTLN